MNKALIGGIIGVIVTGYVGASMYATSVAEEKVEQMLEKVGNDAENITYEDISASPFGEVTIEGLKAVNGDESITLSELTLVGFDDISEDYANIKVIANGLTFAGFYVDETPDDPAEAIKKHVIQESGELDFVLELKMDADADEVRIGSLGLSGDDLGHVSFSGEVKGVARALINASEGFQSEQPEVGVMALMGIQKVELRDLELILEDDGIIDMMLASKSKNGDVDDIRQEMIDKIGDVSKVKDETERQSLEGMVALLEGDGLSITLDEPFVLTMSDVMGSNNGLKRKMAKAKITVDTI